MKDYIKKAQEDKYFHIWSIGQMLARLDGVKVREIYAFVLASAGSSKKNNQ